MAEPPKWQRFEKLAADIQRDLAPHGAVVTQNERILGSITRVLRQIDISVRVPTEVGTMLLVVECKDLSANVDVKDVEAFIGMLADVEANQGIMIASEGFTPAARRRAVAADVQLWTAVDVESADWPASVS